MRWVVRQRQYNYWIDSQTLGSRVLWCVFPPPGIKDQTWYFTNWEEAIAHANYRALNYE